MAEPSREAERASKEISRAAEELHRAARDISQVAGAAQRSWQDYERLFKDLRESGVVDEEMMRGPKLVLPVLLPGETGYPDGLPEDVAALVADESVHRVRKELARDLGVKAPPPSEEDVKNWVERREDRRAREAS